MTTDLHRSGHAVVAGAGVAGCLASIVLADHFERVSVLERARSQPHAATDHGPPSCRAGVPQGRCLHLLMAPGAKIFDGIIPEWRPELEALGAVPFDASRDVALYGAAGPRLPSPAGDVLYGCSRALLETMLRRSIHRRPNIHLWEGSELKDLLFCDQTQRVTGVGVAKRHGGPEETMTADLVLDASGAASMLPQWLAAQHCVRGSAVAESVVDGPTSYVSRWYQLPDAYQPAWSCCSISPSPRTLGRSALLLRAEHNCWGLVLLAPADQPLPTDDQALLAFVVSLGDNHLLRTLQVAKAVSPIHHYGSFTSRWKHYEQCRAWPAGLLALGDAVCCLDPYFGLGMSLAADSVWTLRTALRQAHRPSEGAIQGQIASRIQPVWDRSVAGRPCRSESPQTIPSPSISAFADWAMGRVA